MKIRDRIKDFRRVLASQLVPNPKNWRKHPKAQADALRGLLAEVGFADALLARELPDGRLMLLDGHLRAETAPDSEVPVLILDVDEKEADKILLTLDPLAAMAQTDSDMVKALLDSVGTDNDAVQALIDSTAGVGIADDSTDASGESEGSGKQGLGEMVVAYNLIFDDKSQQSIWFNFIRKLKNLYPAEETIAGRVTAYLKAHPLPIVLAFFLLAGCQARAAMEKVPYRRDGLRAHQCSFGNHWHFGHPNRQQLRALREETLGL